eukprot:9434272-Pyramimonas_sp.AAC.1
MEIVKAVVAVAAVYCINNSSSNSSRVLPDLKVLHSWSSVRCDSSTVAMHGQRSSTDGRSSGTVV